MPSRSQLCRGVAALLRLLGLFAVASLALPALPAAPAPAAEVYECTGTVVHAESGYDGPVSLRALLALDFDLAQGAARHPDITAVEIEQEKWNLWVRTKTARGGVEWSAGWSRNGGFEPTADGVKLLLRPRPGADDLFMFTLSRVNQGGALAVKVERVEATKFGPAGKEIGTFLFLRVTE